MKDLNFNDTLGLIMIIMFILIIAMLWGGCKAQKELPVYNHQAVEQGGYIKIDKLTFWQEKRIANNICDDLGLSYTWQLYKYLNTGNSYIRILVSYDDLNKTKFNIFNREGFIIKDKYRRTLLINNY